MRFGLSAKVVFTGCAVPLILLANFRGQATSIDPTRAQPSQCVESLEQITEPVPSLVFRTKDIVLVQVQEIRDKPDTQWQGDNVEFSLLTIGTIKGDIREHQLIVIGGVRPQVDDRSGEMRNARQRHNSLVDFGYRMVGGMTHVFLNKLSNRCELVPSLVLGKTYLAFLTPPFRAKSFELVETPLGDGWYESVAQEHIWQMQLN
ncbi:MAG: hypothetical protein ABL973_14430 [Micropepsaceae bacterium]